MWFGEAVAGGPWQRCPPLGFLGVSGGDVAGGPPVCPVARVVRVDSLHYVCVGLVLVVVHLKKESRVKQLFLSLMNHSAIDIVKCHVH